MVFFLIPTLIVFNLNGNIRQVVQSFLDRHPIAKSTGDKQDEKVINEVANEFENLKCPLKNVTQ
ncbi:MAG: hypothetical protein ACJ0F1_03955 [Crocinitomicaceae bacterium]